MQNSNLTDIWTFVFAPQIRLWIVTYGKFYILYGAEYKITTHNSLDNADKSTS